jgi:hypothetical protein
LALSWRRRRRKHRRREGCLYTSCVRISREDFDLAEMGSALGILGEGSLKWSPPDGTSISASGDWAAMGKPREGEKIYRMAWDARAFSQDNIHDC